MSELWFAPSEEQLARADRARVFAGAALNDGLEERDASGTCDPDAWRARWRACAAEGLLGLCVPADLGGSGFDVRTAAVILHALGEGCRDNGLLLAINAQIWTVVQPILESASPSQIARYLPGILDGSIIGADAITELAAGSDAMALATSATRDGDEYVLNGEKVFIGMAPMCDVALVYARTNPGAGVWGVSAFLVDTDLPGVTRGPVIQKMGLRTIPTGSLVLRDVRVPAAARLGDEGAGSALFARASLWERQMIFVSHLGRMKRQLDDCVEFARARHTFGKPILHHQSVGNRLADMRLRYETAWLMQMRAAWQMDTGSARADDAALTKLHLSEAFLASSLDAVRLMGARGYLAEADVARDLRDATGGVIYGGTSDIQRHIIAQLMARG